MSIIGASSLLAVNVGDDHCFYCGDKANRSLKVSDTFADGWCVAYPQSKMMCCGCEMSLDEKIAIAGKEKPQKFRNYSWHISRSKATPMTKANKREMTGLLLEPPSEPWAFAIAESGQKHLVYRTPANLGDGPFVVRLEDELVVYSPRSLRDRIDLCRAVVAVVGHKGANDFSVTSVIALGLELALQWEAVYREPLTRLALFVTPGKSECEEIEDDL
jgi:CRISPR type IV-associated protein Csf1